MIAGPPARERPRPRADQGVGVMREERLGGHGEGPRLRARRQARDDVGAARHPEHEAPCYTLGLTRTRGGFC